MSDHPPPIYSQGDGTATQLLLVPPAGSVNFQTGYLGVEGERAAVEGEIQIKDIEPGRWSKVTVSLRTCESAYLREIELALSQVVLFDSRSIPGPALLPSSLPFAIPLTPDTPQSIETHHSGLSHILTATLHPSDETRLPYSKSTVVHTRRYSSHLHSLFPSPETFFLDSPARVEVQVPRTTFKVGEPIPIYITVPPPRREVVVDKGLRLRNVRTELVRVIKVRRDGSDYQELELDEDLSTDGPDGPSSTSTSALPNSKGPPSPLFLGSSYRTVIAQSGATCRFHISRDIKLRQVLHQPHTQAHSSRFQDPPSVDYGSLESDAEGASITQNTLLHSVTFRINVHIAFVDLKSHTERVSHISIPVTMLPPSAPLPEVAASLDEAYQKKHDRPPARTVRHEDADTDVPHYSESMAGPSFAGAPPPFEERDAPPPFSSSEAEASTSARLPTFLESETEIILPDTDHSDLYQSIPHSPIIMGEGLEFGFAAVDQFDGHADDMHRSNLPQTVQITIDADFTALVDVHLTEALGLTLDHGQNVVIAEEPPPPPPAIDDPSDPPPSIDSEYHSPGQLRLSPPAHPSPLLADSYSIEPPPPPHTPSSNDIQPSHGHAPPPYLNTDHHEPEHVTRPPPYVD